MELPGFDRLMAVCRALETNVRWMNPPATEIPDTRTALGQPLDPQLAALLARANGWELDGRNWGLSLKDVGGKNDLSSYNRSLRRMRDDLPRIIDFVLFGQWGHQAAYLATVPALAAADGTQPVMWVDLNEDLWTMPMASSVDRALDLIARYLERDRDRGEITFPWDVPDLIAADAPLVHAIEAGAFKPFTICGEEVAALIDRVVGR